MSFVSTFSKFETLQRKICILQGASVTKLPRLGKFRSIISLSKITHYNAASIPKMIATTMGTQKNVPKIDQEEISFCFIYF